MARPAPGELPIAVLPRVLGELPIADLPRVLTCKAAIKWVHYIHDPLGILNGVITPARIMLDDLQNRYFWDDRWTTDEEQKFIALSKEIMKTDGQIRRNYSFDIQEPVRLHVFCYASNTWIGCKAFITQGNSSTVVASKAGKPAKRLGPILTKPYRELLAMVRGAVMVNLLTETYKHYYKLESHLWSSSQTALSWHANNQKVGPSERSFVHNRLTLIHKHCADTPMHYVVAKQNPAKAVAQGTTADEVLDKNSLYWNGPSCMYEDKINPFTPKENRTDELTDSIVALCLNPESKEKWRPFWQNDPEQTITPTIAKRKLDRHDFATYCRRETPAIAKHKLDRHDFATYCRQEAIKSDETTNTSVKHNG